MESEQQTLSPTTAAESQPSAALTYPPLRPGENALYFETKLVDKMVGRPCRVVEDHGDGTLTIIVDFFDRDLSAGRPFSQRLRVREFRGLSLPRAKDQFWQWPMGKSFVARSTPPIVGGYGPPDPRPRASALARDAAARAAVAKGEPLNAPKTEASASQPVDSKPEQGPARPPRMDNRLNVRKPQQARVPDPTESADAADPV